MNDLNQIALLTGLLGGLALFLFGLDILTEALKLVSGDHLKTLLARMTRNRFVSLAAGASVTALLQSSSVTTVLLVGFISAGMMTMVQSIPIIIGANIGSTVTAQILAFNVTAVALPLVSLGFFVYLAAPRDDYRQYGRILLGMGLVFLGMKIMSDAMAPLRDFPPFLDLMKSLDRPLPAALVGAGFTAIVQSSAATTGILLVMAAQGLIGLEAAIALALGANIGTCATALLAAIGKPREAVRAAVVHTLFNVVGVIIWIGLIAQLAAFARWISPEYPSLSGLDRIKAETPRQIANVHTFFNVANAAIFIGFTGQIARFVEWLIPLRPAKIEPRYAPLHLDPNLLDVPPVALDAVRLELLRLGNLVREMLEAAIPTVLSGSPLHLGELRVMDRPVDLLHREIISYLRQISLADLTQIQSTRLMAYIRIANDLEHIGDQVAIGLVTSARKRIDENVVISPATEAVISRLHAVIVEAMIGSMEALEKEDGERAAKVRAMKKTEAELIEKISFHQVDRLRAPEPQRLSTYAREIELVEELDDVFKTIRRIARTQLGMFRRSSEAKDDRQ
ncbi:Na/Pi cotransporter family protein [Tropicimonas sp. IMCC6043]|uniref:Na/Pi cotransporter family protein n=1 Tax=Tropicimonas sp. IMCC6043 TaxID=2510645 RepID=UPI00101B9806|nr:Na/Pi cotransporter family protein [Tropicimonas sp. IMCC6043]RYH06832.1 Na/Pi cotransporter family protein [Tropicimonas sp. IMCC6043]